MLSEAIDAQTANKKANVPKMATLRRDRVSFAWTQELLALTLRLPLNPSWPLCSPKSSIVGVGSNPF